MREPLLLKNFGHILEERQSKVRHARRGERWGEAPALGVPVGQPDLAG